MDDLKLRVVQAAAAVAVMIVALCALSERARTSDLIRSMPVAESAP
ncbi:hypothetical protein [Aureimonas frigidaquae]|nr:hypothetical protein [Aureimonas frigidaquae]